MVDRRPGYTRESVVEKREYVEKHPYVALQRINEKMSESQKEGVRVWNSLVNFIRKHDMMEEKN